MTNLTSARVLVVGDVMLDIWVRGEVSRISPEGPFPILENVTETGSLGGAGNVVANLCALGCSPEFVAVTGRDDAGEAIRDLLVQLPVKFQLIAPGNVATTIKTRFVVGSHQLLRVDRESEPPANDDTMSRVMDAAKNWLQPNGVVVISDYGKGAIGDGCSYLIENEKTHGIKTIVDPKGSDFRRYAGAYLVTPNLEELAVATKYPVGTDDEIVACARTLQRHGIENVLVTRGADGMTLVTEGGAVEHLFAHPVEVFDVTGAGDTVVAVVAAALATGTSLHDAARLANLAAGIVVGKSGTAVVTPEELFDGSL